MMILIVKKQISTGFSTANNKWTKNSRISHSGQSACKEAAGQPITDLATHKHCCTAALYTQLRAAAEQAALHNRINSFSNVQRREHAWKKEMEEVITSCHTKDSGFDSPPRGLNTPHLPPPSYINLFFSVLKTEKPLVIPNSASSSGFCSNPT